MQNSGAGLLVNAPVTHIGNRLSFAREDWVENDF